MGCLKFRTSGPHCPSKSLVELDKLSHTVMSCLVCIAGAVVPVDGGVPSEESREDIKPCVLFPVNFSTGPKGLPAAQAASNDSSLSKGKSALQNQTKAVNSWLLSSRGFSFPLPPQAWEERKQER